MVGDFRSGRHHSLGIAFVMRRYTWTPQCDEILVTMCKQGATWKAIAVFLGTVGFTVSRECVVERGRRLRCAPDMAKRFLKDLAPAERATETRWPLEAGHPSTWGLIMPGYSFPRC